MAEMSDHQPLDKQALRAREQFRARLHGAELQPLFDYLPDVYFVAKDMQGRVMLANQLAARMCGFERELDMVGKSDLEIFAEDRARGYMQDDRHVFETAESIVDRVEMAPDPNNSINWMVVTKVPLYSSEGEMVGLACIARNTVDTHTALRPYTEMNEVLEHVRLHYAQPIKIDQLAEMVHLSTSQFERRFRQLFVLTPTKHIQNVRVSAACHRLASSHETVATIAAEVGFYDQSHFTRAFQRVMGVSPSEYRKQERRRVL
jgi:PAS domain S-box-containing protein